MVGACLVHGPRTSTLPRATASRVRRMGVEAEVTPVLEARSLHKHFAGVVALSEGNFALHDNEIHAIVGDNGAGKSTLIKILSGALQPDGGELLVDGVPVTIPNPKTARAYGIDTVFQDLALVNHLDASANIFLGRELLRPAPLSWFGVLDKKSMRTRAADDVRRLKVRIKSVDDLVLGMSGGQRQALAVARAVTFGTRMIIMDEPTAALGVRETAAVLDLILELRRQGLSVVMISHSLPEVFEVADRITILRLGRTLTTVSSSGTSLSDIVGLMTGAFVASDDATDSDVKRRLT
jgi:ABC-type sugar transport system ATPase subunit